MNGQLDNLVLELSSTFGAPRERVFALLTEPGELARWWGPHGFTLPDARIDLVVGGAYRFTMQPPDGGPFHLSGRFLEISRPRRLAYTFNWEEPVPDDRETTVTLTLEAEDSGTRLALTQGPFATGERLALHRNGWSESFEKLRRVLEFHG
jgi:uncharacterized protein YndB with AHSA1/START domain